MSHTDNEPFVSKELDKAGATVLDIFLRFGGNADLTDEIIITNEGKIKRQGGETYGAEFTLNNQSTGETVDAFMKFVVTGAPETSVAVWRNREGNMGFEAVPTANTVFFPKQAMVVQKGMPKSLRDISYIEGLKFGAWDQTANTIGKLAASGYHGLKFYDDIRITEDGQVGYADFGADLGSSNENAAISERKEVLSKQLELYIEKCELSCCAGDMREISRSAFDDKIRELEVPGCRVESPALEDDILNMTFEEWVAKNGDTIPL